MYAEIAGEGEEEQKRLFALGYDNGKRFLDAVRRGAISPEELRRVPSGIKWSASGPTMNLSSVVFTKRLPRTPTIT